MTGRRRRQAWLPVALLALILLPTAPATAIALALMVGSTIRTALGVARRRRAPASHAGASALGVDRSGRRVVLGDDELSAHGLILGASGSGKTTTLLSILGEQIRRGRPVVAVDMKGSPAFAGTLARAAAGAGRPFKVWTLDGGAYWNPLAHGNATELKDRLIGTERFTEPHYMRAAERYVQTVLQVLAAVHPGQPPTLNEVVGSMDPARLTSALRHVEPSLRARIQDYRAGLTHDQLSAIRGLETRLAVLTESHTGAFLNPALAPDAPAIDLRAALSGPEVVVFSLNSSRYGALAAQVGTLVLQDLKSASGALVERPGAQTAVIGIDEFSALGADHVIALLARGRESGLCVLVATQELADLERAARGLGDQVVGVTAVKIVHRQEVPESARTVALMAGTEEVWEETRQLAGGLLGDYETGRGTRRRVERPIVHPNEIKTLRTGEAVVISKIRGTRPRTVRISPPRLPPDAGLDR